MTRAPPRTPRLPDDDRLRVRDNLHEIVLRENEGIRRALSDVREQGVDDDAAVCVIEENGRTSIFAMARVEIAKLVASLPANMNLHERIAERAKPGHVWAVVYSVGEADVTGMAMELARIRASRA